MIDARRMEVYSAVFDARLEDVRETQAEIIDENSFQTYLKDKPIVFFGDGAAKCQSILAHNPNAVFFNDVMPSARFMGNLAEGKYKQQQFENVAYFEPFYLKDFIAGVPKVKGLH